MVPFSSDFSLTVAQEISECLSSSCMATVCISPLADQASTSAWLSLLHHSIPGVWHVTAESTGASHIRNTLLRPGILRGPTCVCGSDGGTRVGCDLCYSNKLIETAAQLLWACVMKRIQEKRGLGVFLAPKVRVNFGGASRVRTLALSHNPPEALAGLWRGPRPEEDPVEKALADSDCSPLQEASRNPHLIACLPSWVRRQGDFLIAVLLNPCEPLCHPLPEIPLLSTWPSVQTDSLLYTHQ